MNLKHFKLSEFDSGLGNPDWYEPGSGDAFMNRCFLEALDACRGISGIPYRVMSGYRTPAYNDFIGGAKNSAHTLGLGADVEAADVEAAFRIIHAAMEVGMHGIIWYPNKKFIHLDMGGLSDILIASRPYYGIKL